MREGPKYRPFCDLRSVPEAGTPREQVENHGRPVRQRNRSKITEVPVLGPNSSVKQSRDIFTCQYF